MSERRGPIHDYLVMKLDYSKPGKVKTTMFYYIDGLFEVLPELWLKDTPTLASNHLFEGNRQSMPLVAT